MSRPTPPAAPTPPEIGETPTPAKVEMPADFPQDVPVIEGAELFAVQKLAQDAKNVLFYVDKAAPEIFTYYKDGLKGEGWDVAQEYQAKEQSFLSFRKGKTITNLTIVTDPRSGKRVVAIMYYEEEALPFPEF